MARSKRGIWFKFGRFITGITIACFFLPFFGVSCQGMDVVTVSGADMAGGCKPGGMIVDAQEREAKRPSPRKDSLEIENVDREPLAIVALALAVVVFGLAWVRTRPALLAACVVSLACVGALAGLYIKISGEMSSKVAQGVKAETAPYGGKAGKSLIKEGDVEAGARWGLWLTCAALIGTATISGLAWREREGTEHA